MKKENLDWCIYTYKHRKALLYVIDKYVKDPLVKEEMYKRARVHDMDKILMYFFMEQVESQLYHVEHKSHHLESGKVDNYLDRLEMVLDYESAPYTKPDKPLNAYDFTRKLLSMNYINEEQANPLFEIMHELGIDYSYNTTRDEEGMAFMEAIGEVTEEMILFEAIKYVHENKVPEIDMIQKRIFETEERT